MVATADQPSTSMAVVRVWREGGKFRSTISTRADAASQGHVEQKGAASPEELLRLVEQWLHSF